MGNAYFQGPSPLLLPQCPSQSRLEACTQNFCWVKPNPEAVLQMWLDFQSTGPELSYSRASSIPPSQSCNAETGSSAPTISPSRLLLFLCQAGLYMKPAHLCSLLLLGTQGTRLGEDGAQEDNPDHALWMGTEQTGISGTGVKTGGVGTLEISLD